MATFKLSLFGNQGLSTVSPGDVTTDLYGLETCTAVYKCALDRRDLIPQMRSAHPIFNYLALERRRVSLTATEGYMVITGEYAGVPFDTEPVYELGIGVAEKPISTHPKFVQYIGGKPSAPLNGAIFVDAEGRKTTSDAVGTFSHFAVLASGGTQNAFAGVEAYLDMAEATWRKTFVSTQQVNDISSLGDISNTEGPSPSLGAGRNWLYAGINSQQRGRVFTIVKEWRSSGKLGWNSIIYAP